MQAETTLRRPLLQPLGDAALMIRFADTLSDEANRAAIGAAHRLAAEMLTGATEIVPGLVSVLIRYDPGVTSFSELCNSVRLALDGSETTHVQVATPHNLPVHFAGEDLPEVAAAMGMTIEGFVAAHNSAPLRVLATGFAPGFVYCGLHPPELHLPRRTAVRPMVPAGTVLFAAGQTAIAATPIRTGWHVIGETTFRNFDPGATPPTILSAGDVIAFEART